jgi:hypothetical protein
VDDHLENGASLENLSDLIRSELPDQVDHQLVRLTIRSRLTEREHRAFPSVATSYD